MQCNYEPDCQSEAVYFYQLPEPQALCEEHRREVVQGRLRDMEAAKKAREAMKETA